MAGWSFSWILKNLMRRIAMDKDLTELAKRMWKHLEKVYSGDRSEMREAIEFLGIFGMEETGQRMKMATRVGMELNLPSDRDVTRPIIKAARFIEANWDDFTTELTPPPSPGQQKPESYNQLTLDFSATTELSPLGANSRPRHNAPQTQEDETARSLTTFPNESIFLAISREGTRKGWLSPQYKFKFDKKSSTTTRWDGGGKGRVWGPYWMFCWARPGGNDGHYYLGKAEGKKFQHFCEAWRSAHSLEEVLRRLGVR
jgi:hypothetical protein